MNFCGRLYKKEHKNILTNKMSEKSQTTKLFGKSLPLFLRKEITKFET